MVELFDSARTQEQMGKSFDGLVSLLSTPDNVRTNGLTGTLLVSVLSKDNEKFNEAIEIVINRLIAVYEVLGKDGVLNFVSNLSLDKQVEILSYIHNNFGARNSKEDIDGWIDEKLVSIWEIVRRVSLFGIVTALFNFVYFYQIGNDHQFTLHSFLFANLIPLAFGVDLVLGVKRIKLEAKSLKDKFNYPKEEIIEA